jgi:hypothetical protein
MLLIHEKGFENGMRIALVQIVADHLDGAGLLTEAIIELNQLVRAGFRRSSMLMRTIWHSWVTALAAQ